MRDNAFLERMILDEIKAKNAAIHAYDRMCWTVRSGFLTLFFAGWGLVLGGMVKENRALAAMAPVAKCLLVISLGLAIGGLIIDLGYVVGKFKVVHDLNKLLKLLLEYGNDFQTLIVGEGRQALRDCLRLSGNTKGGSLEEGWKQAAGLGALIYAVPFLLTYVGLLVAGIFILPFRE